MKTRCRKLRSVVRSAVGVEVDEDPSRQALTIVGRTTQQLMFPMATRPSCSRMMPVMPTDSSLTSGTSRSRCSGRSASHGARAQMGGIADRHRLPHSIVAGELDVREAVRPRRNGGGLHQQNTDRMTIRSGRTCIVGMCSLHLSSWVRMPTCTPTTALTVSHVGM